MIFEEENNQAYVRGAISSTPKYSHTVFNEKFYEMNIVVPRLSTQEDVIPITISEKLLEDNYFQQGDEITFFGQFRSYNKIVNEKNKLVLTFFARDILENDTSINPNFITLSGYVCKPCVYRTTPFNREIADILVAVNRSYNKSDYLPCIAWGKNARLAKHLEVGEKIAISGRIQSRKYIKRYDETIYEEKMAYEISVSKLAFDTKVEDFFAKQNAIFEEIFEKNINIKLSSNL